MVTSTIRRTAPTLNVIRLARVERSTRKDLEVEYFKARMLIIGLTCFGKETAGSEQQNGDKHHMADQEAPSRIQAETDSLGHPEQRTTGQGAPERAHAADDYRLEGVDQL